MGKWTSQYSLYEIIHNFISDNPNLIYSDIKLFCRSKNWNTIHYTNSDKELLKISNDGYTFYENGQFSIFYNKDKPKTRQRFTIAHEIGHIILYHHLYIPSNILMNNKNKGVWECQADTFAQNILFPTELAITLKGHSYYKIARYLGVSQDMVNVRYRNLSKDLYWLDKLQSLKNKKSPMML